VYQLDICYHNNTWGIYLN